MHAASRSLASYFDDTSGGVSGSTTDWHDQMEAYSQPTIKSLGKWMWHPQFPKQVWVPDEAEGNMYAKPAHVPYQLKPEKGEAWDPNAWGKADYDRKAAPQPKQTDKKPKSTDPAVKAQESLARKQARQERYDALNKIKKDIRDQAWAIFMKQRAWDARIYPIMKLVKDLQEDVKKQKNERIAELKGTGTSKTRLVDLHKETSHVIDPSVWGGPEGYLEEIDKFCQHVGVMNMMGKKLPRANADGSYYLSVTAMFLSKAKEVVLTGTLHAKAVRAKAGIADAQECDFINLSYQANDVMAKLRGKDKYPKKLNMHLEDTPVVEAWKDHEREIDGMIFHALHPGKKLPKHLSLRPPPQPRGPGKKGKEGGGKGHGGGGGASFEQFAKMYQAWEHMQKTQHHHPIHHSSQPPKGDPHGVPGPPRPPAGGRGRRIPAVPPAPPRAQSYMQGYTYYCD